MSTTMHPGGAGRYDPAVQVRQSSAVGPAAVVLVEYRPGAHGPVHELSVDAPAPYLPASQCGQFLRSLLSYFPAGQAMQLPAAGPAPVEGAE